MIYYNLSILSLKDIHSYQYTVGLSLPSVVIYGSNISRILKISKSQVFPGQQE